MRIEIKLHRWQGCHLESFDPVGSGEWIEWRLWLGFAEFRLSYRQPEGVG